MANNIKTIIRFDADDDKVNKILNFIKPSKGREAITFHKIVPRPSKLDVPAYGVTADAIYYALFANRENREKLMPWLEVLNKTKYYGFLGGENLLQNLFCQYKMSFFYQDVLCLNISQEQKDWFCESLLSVREKTTPEDIKKEYKCFAISNYGNYDKSIKTFLELGERCLDNLLLFGSPTWFEWSIKNWGTKWDAFSSFYNETEKLLILETANSAALPIFAKLSEIFSDVKITVKFAAEDIGCNCGMVSFLNGEPTDTYFPEKCSTEAIKFACEVWGMDLEEFYKRFDD